MSELEFACNVWGHKKVLSGKISRERIIHAMELWKSSLKSVKAWKKTINIKDL